MVLENGDVGLTMEKKQLLRERGKTRRCTSPPIVILGKENVRTGCLPTFNAQIIIKGVWPDIGAFEPM